jgi:hypothetical protein
MAKNKPGKISQSLFNEITDFDIKINSFGEIETNISIDKLNEFLNKKGSIKSIQKNTNDEEE